MICTTIKSGTIKIYLGEAASIALNHSQANPLSNECIQDAKIIKNVLSRVKRWESMPNHRKPFTVKMVLNMHEKCKKKHPDSLDSVLGNWNVLDIFY